MSTSISSTLRTPHPSLPYRKIKEDILGPSYNLSLVFIGTKRAQKLNKEHRKKTYVPNVLSFPLNTHTGEIFITPARAHVEAKKYDLTPKGYIGFLFIHGLLHLKGYPHGATMEKAEKRYISKYKLK